MHNKTHSVCTKLDRRDNRTVLGVYKVQLDGGSSWMLHIPNEKSNSITQASLELSSVLRSYTENLGRIIL